MKNAFLRVLLLLASVVFTTNTFSQQIVTTQQWQEDLLFLQNTVHSEYPFLFKKVDREFWNQEVKTLYGKIPDLEQHEIAIGFARIVSLFEYGHTHVRFSTVAKNGVLPVNLYRFKDGIYVEGAQAAYEEMLGSRVLKVGDVSVDEALAMIRPVVPAENAQYFERYGLRYLTVPAVLHAQGIVPSFSSTIKLTVVKEREVKEYALPTIALDEMSRGYGFTIPNNQWLSVRMQEETPLYLKHLEEKYYYFEYLSDSKTLYVRQSSAFNHESETLSKFYARLFDFIDSNEIDKFVYDVRLNGGGNNYNNIPLIQGIMARPGLNARGKFFYVIGKDTYSAAQNLTNDIETYTNAIMLGEPTSENKNFYGDANEIVLPNSEMSLFLSFAWWQDKPQWENEEATSPHFVRQLTFEEYRTNKDPVLEMAIETDFSSMFIDPVEHLTNLFIAGEMEQLQTDLTRILPDPMYQHIAFDEEFVKQGEFLMSQEQFESAIFVFSMVTQAFPDNSTSWKRLGEAFNSVGMEKEAGEAFSKASSLENN